MRSVFGSVTRLKAAASILTLAASFCVAAGSPAQARHHHHGYSHHSARHGHVRHAFGGHHRRGHFGVATSARGGYLAPTYSSIIVDANTGRTLSATNENAPHHPASVTKVMTLYLLFEQMEKGRLSLDSELSISPHAAAQQPTKLGLRPGSSIDVEDAIKAVVTKSANDIAVAIAENIGGDEETFAQMMTRRARSLGMNGTTYRNASGLPNPEQITTARDLSILGRAIQDRFPKYYKYFATRSFYYRGQTMPNHNHLLGRIEGMDGIKTGYTAASGFNLLTSVKRDGRYIVGAVLGGRSAPQRDHIMAGLIEDNLPDASAKRTAVAVTERDVEMVRPSARIMEAAPEDDAEPVAAPVRAEPARVEPRVAALPPEPKAEPRRAETAAINLAVPAVPAKLANRADDRPRPAFVTALKADTETTETISGRAARRAASDGSTGRSLAYAAPATATPSSLRWTEGPHGRVAPRLAAEDAKASSHRTEVAKSEPHSTEKAAAGKAEFMRPGNTGWMIQIGATEDADKAHDLLARARTRASLASAKPFTEKVQKGGGTLWRARFAGLEEDSAEAACKSLKRSGFSCFATRN